MIKILLVLTALALVQARPNEDAELTSGRLYEPHEDCPPTEIHFLLPHEYDCTKFYYCEYGLKWIEPRNCAPGTEFNAELQVCVHPNSSGCTLPGFSTTPADVTTSTAAVTTPSPTTAQPTTPTPTTAEPTTAAPTTAEPTTAAPTTAEPTTAAPTTAEPTTAAPTTAEPTTAAPTTAAPTTAAPTTAEPTTSAPTTAAPTTAAPTTAAPTTSAPTTAAPTTPGAITPVPSTSAPVSTANPDDCEILENGCPADFHIHKLLPHEEYCHMFYYCDKGQLVPRYCAPGTYFNPELEVCDWPHNVDCVNDGPYTYPTTSAPTTTTSSPGGGENEDILDNGCPASLDVHQLIPHETDCNKFYHCVFGEKVERSCAPGTYFNYEIQACDWPHNVNCVSSSTTPGGPPGDTSSSEEIPIPSDPVDPEAPVEWDPLPNGCPNNFDVHHLLPHESDCNKFYYCVAGEAVETKCPDGTHFNPKEQVCDWPHLAGCENGNGSCSGGGNGGCTSTTAAPGDTTGTTAATGGTTGTTAATSGTAGTTAATSGTAGTTAATSGTAGTTAATSGTAGTTAAPGDTTGTTAAPSDTTGTTAATGGTAGTTAATSGTAGTTASTGATAATTPSTSATDTTSPAADDTTGTTAAAGGTAGTTPTPAVTDGTTSAPECGSCQPSPADRCKSGCNVLPFVHDNDCDKYWICEGDQPVLVTCSEGLHFNPSTYTCDFICNAGCERKNVQVTTLDEGVKIFLPWGSITNEIRDLLKNELHGEL